MQKKLFSFKPHQKQDAPDSIEINDLNDPKLNEILGQEEADKLREEVELITGVYPEFSTEDYLNGTVTPVFFGSALNNFGIRELLNCFIKFSPPPKPRETDKDIIEPNHNKFSGFIFKIHANIDPKHRDRIAFLRICSGIFERNKRYLNVRSEKEYKFSNYSLYGTRKNGC